MTVRRLALVALVLAGCAAPAPRPSPTSAPSPAVVVAASGAPGTPRPEWVTFDGEGFAFQYAGRWREIAGYSHVGEHGPTLMAAVGIGDFDLGCAATSASGSCTGPSWTVPDRGVVFVYRFDAWLGPIAPEPVPTLGPDDKWIDVGDRFAIRSEDVGALRLHFPGAPEYIEARWDPDATGEVRDEIEIAIVSWTWDIMPSPTPPSASVPATEPPPAGFGILDVRPDGWSFIGDPREVEGYPGYSVSVYGPDGATAPPFEGPGRVALYEVFRESNPYLDHRVEQSRERGGHAVAVEVNGQPAEVWVDAATGELLLGWSHRGKSDLIVANAADYTIDELVASAEGLGECCG